MADFKTWDAVLRIIFRCMLLLFILGLMIFFFHSVIFSEAMLDKASGAGISISGITGMAWFYVRVEYYIKVLNNSNEMSPEALNQVPNLFDDKKKAV